MKIKSLLKPVGMATVAFGIAAASAGPAWAIDNIQTFGKQEVLSEWNVVTGYTVTDLRPSSDPIAYPVAGRLYEATVTVDAIEGLVNPRIQFFNARAENGDNYRVITNVPTPQGIAEGPLAQGDSTTGKIYFDVVGADPNSVVFNNGDHDILGWVPS